MADAYVGGFLVVFVFALIRDPVVTLVSFIAGAAVCAAYGVGA
jgi:hypothetical protein